MPFQMKIQPIDSLTQTRLEPVKPVVKSRLKRLFDIQFLRSSTSSEKVVDEPHFNKDTVNGSAAQDFEPSSICLAKMVQSFIEESHEKQSSGGLRCSRNRCNCFNGNCNDSSEDEVDSLGDSSNVVSSSEAVEILKSLVPCASVCERNLLADTSRIIDKNKICKRKDDSCLKIVTDGLVSLGYDASICKSRWDKSPSHPAGEYEYIEVITSGERILIDIDFRSEFEIARSTKSYNSLLQILPSIFVGKADRLQKIISVVCDAAKQSLKKKGMHIPPWRKAEYVKAKWLCPHTRATSEKEKEEEPLDGLEPRCQEKNSDEDETVFALSSDGGSAEEEETEEEEEKSTAVKEWKLPEIKPKSSQLGAKMVTGLASVIED